MQLSGLTVRTRPTLTAYVVPYRLGLGSAVGAATSINPLAFGISAGVSLATDAINQWITANRISGQQKIATTEIVNQLEQQLRANLAAYMALPVPRSQCDQAQALANFDAGIAWLEGPSGCSQMQFGAAGEACIQDRIGTANGGNGKYDWYAYYRTPIANDTNVLPNSGCGAFATTIDGVTTATAGAASNTGGSTAGSTVEQQLASVTGVSAATISELVLPVGLLLAALLLFK